MLEQTSSLSRQLWYAIFTVNITLLGLLAWSFLYIEPGTSSYVIGQISTVILLCCLVGVLLALRSGWEPF